MYGYIDTWPGYVNIYLQIKIKKNYNFIENKTCLTTCIICILLYGTSIDVILQKSQRLSQK